MAKRTQRGRERRGSAVSYFAIDGTEFSIGQRTAEGVYISDRYQAKRQAGLYSDKVLNSQGLRLEGTQLFDVSSGQPLGEDWGAAIQTRFTEQQQEQKFGTLQEALLGTIEKGGAETQELLRRQAARRGGQIGGFLRRGQLGLGQDPARAEALTRRLTGQQGRLLQDALLQSQAFTTGQLGQARQFGIGTELSLEGMGQQMRQFLMSQQLEREKYQAMLDIQPEWWETALGAIGGGAGQGMGMLATASLMG